MSDTKPVTRLEIYDSSGNVVIETESARYIFEPGAAIQVANAMLDAATACGAEIEVKVVKPREVSAMQRAALVARVGHIMRSLQSRNPEYIAMQIVDTILAGTQ